MKRRTFFIESLGCAKNTVDSESMAALLQQDGYQLVEKPGDADVMIVNTCGFIQPAREESLGELKQLAKKKRKNQVLIAAGCLPQRSAQMIVQEVPGVDGILSTRRWPDIVRLAQLLRGQPGKPHYDLPDVEKTEMDAVGVVRAAVQGGSAYLKIADGCRRNCAFCSIPIIKGTAVSRPVEAIVSDAHRLEEAGVQELILIAQDTTDYGSDLGMRDGLAALLERLTSETPQIPWLRILYAFPGFVTDHLIDVMASRSQIVHYLDIPLQHAHAGLLKSMHRPANLTWVDKTLAKMRRAMPDLALRTTFIVGYPGETETEFSTLLDFVRQTEFDHVGVFAYSFEPGTPGEPLGDPIPEEVKQERVERLMALQEQISLKKNQAKVGSRLDVLVEGYNQGISIGRTYRDAPEIDGLVLIEGRTEVGQIVPVYITGAMTHDLVGLPAGK